MEHEFWHKRWEENQIAFHQPEPNPLLRRFWPRLGLPPAATVFVPLCGKSPDMLWLAEQSHRVLGIELSPIAVSDFFSDNGMAPSRSRDGHFERWAFGRYVLCCGDFFALRGQDLDAVAGVYDRASLIAFPPQARRSYAGHLLATIPDAAPILLLTVEYPQAEMNGPPFAVPESEVLDLFSDSRDIEQLHTQDALARSQRFRDKGLSWMTDKVYLLRPQSDAGSVFAGLSQPAP